MERERGLATGSECQVMLKGVWLRVPTGQYNENYSEWRKSDTVGQCCSSLFMFAMTCMWQPVVQDRIDVGGERIYLYLPTVPTMSLLQASMTQLPHSYMGRSLCNTGRTPDTRYGSTTSVMIMCTSYHIYPGGPSPPIRISVEPFPRRWALLLWKRLCQIKASDNNSSTSLLVHSLVGKACKNINIS